MLTNYFKIKTKPKKERIEFDNNSYLITYQNINLINKTEFDEIWKSKPDKIHHIKINGNLIPVPRTQILYALSNNITYRFSGTTIKPEDIVPQYVTKCFDFVKMEMPEYEWNGALVNFYETGQQYIGKHSDDERDLVQGSPIWSFSFSNGSGNADERIFRIRSKTTNFKQDFITYNNSIIVMCGNFQKTYTHEIVKTTKNVARRINVTIRSFK